MDKKDFPYKESIKVQSRRYGGPSDTIEFKIGGVLILRVAVGEVYPEEGAEIIVESNADIGLSRNIGEK